MPGPHYPSPPRNGAPGGQPSKSGSLSLGTPRPTPALNTLANRPGAIGIRSRHDSDVFSNDRRNSPLDRDTGIRPSERHGPHNRLDIQLNGTTLQRPPPAVKFLRQPQESSYPELQATRRATRNRLRVQQDILCPVPGGTRITPRHADKKQAALGRSLQRSDSTHPHPGPRSMAEAASQSSSTAYSEILRGNRDRVLDTRCRVVSRFFIAPRQHGFHRICRT